MNRDEARHERNLQALEKADLDALICALPMNVLLLTGYFSVVGKSIAVLTREGQIILIVPADERGLAEKSWADRIETCSTGSLKKIQSLTDVVRKTLAKIARSINIIGRIGFENAAASEPSSYAAMNFYGASLYELIAEIFKPQELVPASDLLSDLRSTLTPGEIERLKTACLIAGKSFLSGAEKIREGLQETEIAWEFGRGLSVFGHEFEAVERAGGFTFCMSGENSFEAFAAFQRSRARRIQNGDLVLIHCNSFADGFWTDITRTFCLGKPDEKKQKMYEAVFVALEAAIAEIRPGVRASEVDSNARRIMEKYGFGKEFKHALGHAVGYQAIDHLAPPRFHPASRDVLKTGMVFNVEPAIYIENFGGIRHCEMVAVSENGAEILTPFQRRFDELNIAN